MNRTFDVQTLELNSPAPASLIEANAGTGKTYTIQRLYRRFIETCGYKTSEILVVTFTEAATAELRGRIRKELVDALKAAGPEAQGEEVNQVRLAVASFDEAAIFTIHSFCQRALSEFAFESGVPFDCELNPNMQTVLQETVYDFYRSRLSREHSPDVDLETLLKFARVVMKQPKPVVGNCPDVKTADARLRQCLAATPLPNRASGFKAALEQAKEACAAQDEEGLLRMIAEGALQDQTAQRNAPELVDAIKVFQDAKQNEVLLALQRFLEDPMVGLEARKQRAQMMGFDDLLIRMKDAMQGASDAPLAQMLRRTYKVALVDEFQDTDPVQYAIFHTAFNVPGSKLYMIGDPKQAIYAFRGGDVYAYLEAKQQVTEEQRYTLTHNYRASQELIAATNRFFEPERAFLEAAIDYVPSSFGERPRPQLLCAGAVIQKPYKLVWCRGTEDDKPVSKTAIASRFLAEAAEQIVALLMDERLMFHEEGQPPRRIEPKDIVVLVDTNPECSGMKQVLQRKGVPSVIYKSGNVFASQDAEDLYHILSALYNPSQTRELRAALLTVWGGKSIAELDQWKREGAELADIAEHFRRVLGVWQEQGVFRALTLFMSTFQGLSHVAQRMDCERRLANYRQLLEILHEEEKRVLLHPEGLLRFLQQQISDSGTENEAYEERLESDRLAVTVMTIHKSKGLQFPIVVCPTVSLKAQEPGGEDAFDLVHASGGLLLPLSRAEKATCLERMKWEAMSEKIRLLYVAMTRAANYCILLGGNVTHRNGQNAFNYLGKSRTATLDLGSTEAPRLPALGAPGAEQPFGDAVELLERNDKTLGAVTAKRFVRAETAAGLAAPKVCRRIESSFSVMSYSGMVEHGSRSAKAGDDEVADRGALAAALPLPDVLPGGKNMGQCMHDIFEQIDFGDPASWSLQIGQKAKRNAFNLFEKDVEQRTQRMEAILSSVMNRSLPEGFSLASVPTHDTRREWEFHFPVPTAIPVAAFEKIGLAFKTSADKRKGFMTGFVDLLFRKEGRYYYADWKTDRLPDYAPAELHATMVRTAYLFQAIVYGVALYEHLRLTLGSDFSYETHFGGGYYFFVRGVDAENGVFSYRPDERELLQWRALLMGR